MCQYQFLDYVINVIALHCDGYRIIQKSSKGWSSHVVKSATVGYHLCAICRPAYEKKWFDFIFWTFDVFVNLITFNEVTVFEKLTFLDSHWVPVVDSHWSIEMIHIYIHWFYCNRIGSLFEMKGTIIPYEASSVRAFLRAVSCTFFVQPFCAPFTCIFLYLVQYNFIQINWNIHFTISFELSQSRVRFTC